MLSPAWAQFWKEIEGLVKDGYLHGFQPVGCTDEQIAALHGLRERMQAQNQQEAARKLDADPVAVLRRMEWRRHENAWGDSTDLVECSWCVETAKADQHGGEDPADPATALHDDDCKLALAIGALRKTA